ncbi:MAG: hypothetical protein IT451_02000 [Candidatus Brocadia sp.]|nr:hypothetical protein [Candidatus Brocadia sp.]
MIVPGCIHGNCPATKGKFWQTSFYDHFLRKEEDVRDTVMYVLNNPVRKGLVAEWREYPYSGSFVYDV